MWLAPHSGTTLACDQASQASQEHVLVDLRRLWRRKAVRSRPYYCAAPAKLTQRVRHASTVMMSRDIVEEFTDAAVAGRIPLAAWAAHRPNEVETRDELLLYLVRKHEPEEGLS